MNNTSQIKSRMKSIKQTVQIANAQKLIAASRIGRAKRMLSDTAPFHNRIRQCIAEVLALNPEATHKQLGGESSRRGVLLITSDRGLAGGYNNNILKFTEQSLEKKPTDHLVVLGNIGRSHFLHTGKTLDTAPDVALEPPNLYAAREIAEQITALFESGEVDGFDVIYTHFRSAVRLEPREARLFPLGADVFGGAPVLQRDVTFEPSPDDVLSMLMPKYLKGFIYGCLLHAWASELASRISAMDSAIRNGNEMLETLSLVYNRARQALITQEITEIVAGATAMIEE